ncbi:mannose-1-phosphate guanylyltransferase/mannose-6-phosphate isomerase [Pelagibius marinus]|uniref:mannose-1-phosphate guanylyltransferase/mannose-6-phosphate isomerase n=1 Tax=Pelagibius marinus TaxID=2762760 RepID=UPI0018723DFE|nr:mannose-1-phosphate guanylyltransferase/mannose-6-phosphate isomerase [Pelagibius marinus]
MARSQQIHPIVLAGGSGTRLWPISRSLHPKPFVSLAAERTLLQMTVARLADPQRFTAPLVVCNKAHRFLVAEQLQQVAATPQHVVLEPVARNTAAAACTAALLIARENPDALLMLVPSDHLVQDEKGFLEAVDCATAAAESGWIVTFGARPVRLETGYGYIQKGESLAEFPGSFRIARFVEKPDRSTAEGYLSSGQYLWNSGMYLMSARRLLAEMERYEASIVLACRGGLERGIADEDFLRLDEDAFSSQPSLSFDVAVSERTSYGVVVPIDIGWSDVGSWEALYRVTGKDDHGNVLIGDVVAVDCNNSYLRSAAMPIAALGLDGLTVVGTRDALLVCPRERSQDLSLMVRHLAEDPRYASLVRGAEREAKG